MEIFPLIDKRPPLNKFLKVRYYLLLRKRLTLYHPEVI